MVMDLVGHDDFKHRETRTILTREERRWQEFEDICWLLEQGATKTRVAELMGISLKTLHNIIKEYRGKELHKLHFEAVQSASRRVAVKLGKITEMGLDEILKKNDRKAALTIIQDTGVLAELKPKHEEKSDTNRVVIEWSGPQLPWAPAGFLKQTNGESQAGTETVAETIVVPPVSEP